MTRRSRRSGSPFQPDLLRRAGRDEVNAAFLQEADHWHLQYRCEDCANRRRDGSCLYAWPSEPVQRQPFVAVDSSGIPQFCRAFEPDGA